ncbi:hypothetical protein FQN50_005395 [Emmonsiellopsis sp. PD_5]|nr:hypothetical protein FQN50_005395 [Emmonsiellopsis sp. PD_5]
MTILLLGGRGKTSTRLAALLSAANIPFLLASRTTSSTTNPPHPQAKFDWLDESTWDTPFAVATATQHQNEMNSSAAVFSAVYLVAPQVLDMVPLMNRFVDFARGKGVRRFVLLSGSPLEKGGAAMGGVHGYLAELGELGEGVEWAVLRPSWFMENLSEGPHLPSIKTENKIRTATNEGRIAFISADDIARVAFRALTDEVPHNTDHLILGPELLSYDQVAEILSSVLGRKISHGKLSGEEFGTFLTEKAGIERVYADMLAGMDVAISKGSEERMNDVVERVTGEKPKTFREFAEGVKGVWG